MAGGNTYAPETQLPIALDAVVIGARALPLEYHGAHAEALEDGAREWLGTTALMLARKADPTLVPMIERVIRVGRQGDANADRAVEVGASSLIEDAERSRTLGRELISWCRRSFTILAPIKARKPVKVGVGV